MNGGRVDTFRYYILTEAFNTTDGDLNRIVQSIDYVRKQCEDVLPLGTFTSNQDVARFGSYTSDISVSRVHRVFCQHALTLSLPISWLATFSQSACSLTVSPSVCCAPSNRNESQRY